jgi:secreted Zn-dependent insulinase-like peptidase
MNYKNFSKGQLYQISPHYLTFLANLEGNSIKELVGFSEEFRLKGCHVLKKEDFTQIRPSKIRKNTHFIFEHQILEPKQNNSDVCLAFQAKRQPNSRVLCLLLSNYLDVPFFTELRTKQQIGYIVDVFSDEVRGINSMNFAIQAERFPSNEISMKIIEFLDSIRTKFENLDEEEFLTYKNSILNKITQKDLNLFREAERYWFEVCSHQFVFDRKENEKEIVEQLKKEEFLTFAKEILWEKPRNCRNSVGLSETFGGKSEVKRGEEEGYKSSGGRKFKVLERSIGALSGLLLILFRKKKLI